MNIITNDCLGGFIYRDVLKTDFQNPFIWTQMNYKTFIKLIEEYENLNFNNVHIDKNGQELKNNFITVIDDKIRIENIHIFYSEKDEIPRIEAENVFYKKPDEYIKEKYIKRQNRMCGKPIVIVDDKFGNYDELIKICKTKKYRCMIFTNNLIENKTHDLYIKNFNIPNLKAPWQFTVKYKEEIKNWVNENE